MTHTFLLESGRWLLQGSWLDRDGPPIPVKGKLLVAWNRDNWYTQITKLTFPGSDRSEIALQYRGRFANSDRRYAFVLNHSDLGKVEGEGWIAPETIVQRYWVLGDRQRRTGFETLHQIDEQSYYMTSSIMAGHYLASILEATVERVERPEE
ncbi:MAG: hypothetical protein ACFB8W_00660 [Elainellaceae cyanobacterium]